MNAEQLLFLQSAGYQLTNRLKRGKVRPSRIKHVLIVKLDEIGDMVNCLHIFPMLNKAFPSANIELLCKPMNEPLVKNFKEIDLIHFDSLKLKRHYDIRIDLRGDRDSLKWAQNDPGAHYVGRGLIRILNKIKGGQTHEVITNRNIIRPLFQEPLEENYLPSFRWAASEEEKIHQLLQSINSPYCVFHIGARDPARRWPRERWASLMTYLQKTYNQTLLIGGGPDEKDEVCDFLETYGLQGINLCGILNINEFALLCSKASLFVGNESGPLHLSWVSGCPSIGLFGPGVPHVFYPLGEQHRVVHHYMGHQPGNPQSMLKISVDEVKSLCNELLRG